MNFKSKVFSRSKYHAHFPVRSRTKVVQATLECKSSLLIFSLQQFQRKAAEALKIYHANKKKLLKQSMIHWLKAIKVFLSPSFRFLHSFKQIKVHMLGFVLRFYKIS